MLSLGLGKRFMQLYVFLLDLKVIFSNPWRSIRAYTLHQDLSFCSLKRLFANVATRSKRVYTLVDLPCRGLFTLGSKKAYTPREVINLGS
jgi:hypothetical protein